jgi:DNA-binding NarL/FixJ family response regulator
LLAKLRGVRILIVDDSAAVRSRLIARLAEAGLGIAGEAGTASAALAVARATEPDAIILDLHLPDQSGLEILPELKARIPRATIAVLTNHPDPEYRKRCFELGADHFFDKSAEVEDLMALFATLGK